MKKELESPIQTIRIYSQDIGMQFGKALSGILIEKTEKDRRNITDNSRKN